MKVDLHGKKIGSLTILEKLKEKYAGRQTQWKCQCDCGKIIIRTSASLLRAKQKIKSCGCKNYHIDHGNKKYNDPKEVSYNGLINRYLQKAKDRDLEFSISREKCILLFNSECHYCGCLPDNDYNVYASKSGRSASSNIEKVNASWIKYNGIDRIDSDMPYVLNNVVAACSKCNYAKLAMTTEEFYLWLRKVYEHAKNCGHI